MCMCSLPYTVKPQFCVPKFCIFYDFTHFFLQSGQMPTGTMFPRFYTPGFYTILGGPPKYEIEVSLHLSSWCGALELSYTQSILQLLFE